MITKVVFWRAATTLEVVAKNAEIYCLDTKVKAIKRRMVAYSRR